MLFNSVIFALFFALFFPIYLLVRRSVHWRNCLLIVASYLFYGWWDARFLILVAISTSVDYLAALGAAGSVVRAVDKLKSVGFLVAVTVGSLLLSSPAAWWLAGLVAGGIVIVATWQKLIERVPTERRRKGWLYLSLFANLGILGFFKYFNFFVDSVESTVALVGLHTGTLRGGPSFLPLSIILPVGLSFYTFQAISRTIDSYRGNFTPAYSIVNYAAFHAFFPQLVAGPIERAGHLMPQFETVRPLNREMITSGALLFTWGLYQKVVIADNVAPIANVVFSSPVGQTAGGTLAGVLAFAIQIYCDFCGYSNMARGVARCLGFDLMVNFRLPYFARTPSEFWQRWHISLSSWLRDYLYIPLGGNRAGHLGMYRNLMLTMLLGGLWHGAAWTFVVWGAFHGSIQVIYRTLHIDSLLERIRFVSLRGFPIHVLSWAATMMLVMVGWILFRAKTFGVATTVLSNIWGVTGYTHDTFLPLIAYATPLTLAEIYQRASGNLEILNVGPFLLRYTLTLAVLLALILFSAGGGHQFIYFDF